MAAVTGPISSLPGSSHDLPEGTMCDNHPNTPAVARIQGETDSMGSEMNDMCKACLDKHRTAMKEWHNRTAQCDWCKCSSNDIANFRDMDEGMAGPVYQVCQPCRKSYMDNLKEELDDNDYFMDDYIDDDDDVDYIDVEDEGRLS